MPRAASTDRRVRKTRELLHGALASLIHEKGYDAIVVKEILARADVGRSTFYAHYRDKDELLDSGIRDMLPSSGHVSPARSIRTADHVLRFSRPFLEHVGRWRRGSTMDPQRLTVVHERLEKTLAELVAADLRRAASGREASEARVPSDLLARHVASSFVVLIEWWCQQDPPLPVEQVDDLYRSLVLPAVARALA